MHRQMTELPSRVINKWQVEGGDLCILPIGSAEVLGPHLPIGARTFVAEAFAKLLAEAADGLYLPVLPLVPVKGSARLAGTIDVSELPFTRLIRALMDDMLATGFRRIVLATFLEYQCYYTPTEFYEDHNLAAAGININDAVSKLVQQHGIDNDSVVLGALKILGRDDLVAKCLAAAERWKTGNAKNAPPPEAYATLAKIGIPGVHFPKGCYPMPPAEVIDPDAGATVIREVVAEKAPALDDLTRYNHYLARRYDRGMMRGGQFKD